MASFSCHVVGVAKQVRLERIVRRLADDGEAPSTRQQGRRRFREECLPKTLDSGWGSLHTQVSPRSEERSVGKECVSKCRYRWEQYIAKNKKENNIDNVENEKIRRR